MIKYNFPIILFCFIFINSYSQKNIGTFKVKYEKNILKDILGTWLEVNHMYVGTLDKKPLDLTMFEFKANDSLIIKSAQEEIFYFNYYLKGDSIFINHPNPPHHMFLFLTGVYKNNIITFSYKLPRDEYSIDLKHKKNSHLK